MIPIFCNAKNPVYIEKILYYFEPSIDGKKNRNGYDKINNDYIRNLIFENNKKKFLKKLSSAQ